MVVIITGASTGIGAALAVEYGRRGHKVGLVARRAELLAEVAAAVKAAGGEAAFAPADVTRRADLAEAVGTLESALGPCDLLVANAGVGEPTPAHKVPIDTIERILDLNVKGVLYAIGAVLPGMLTRKSGHITAVSSVAGFRGLPGTGGYSASKACVTTLLESFRVDLRRRGIAVTSINPGFIETPLTAPNKFPMPFLMKADRAARIIADGIESRPAELTFPWPMKLLMHFARIVPNWLYDLVIVRASPMK
jgi:NADP-dependent 3-hydroxy acid dehydrogenase YdfG